MDDRKLEVFLKTIQTGSFSKAAAELNCTQSAVTQTMNNLEGELGIALLDRSHKGVVLTPAGEKLLPLIIEAKDSIDRIVTLAGRLSEGKESPIRIGCFSSIATSWLPHAIKTYQKDNPAAVFSIKIGTENLSDLLLSHKIDLALGDTDRLKGFRFMELMKDPYCAVYPKGVVDEKKKSISIGDFGEYPFIMAPENALKSHLIDLPKDALTVSCDDDFALLSMVSQGLGATAMPRLSIRNLPDNVSVYDLEPRSFRTLGIALPNSVDQGVKSFVKFLQKCREDGTLEGFCHA
ncbi:DNA-binding transcriptional regulator, LysR family [Lachnospiraceae bacterium G11]|nr:DNA-binding transcriptional regulator, LysR family [Lachnospiraceae bacterium G11]